MKRNNDSLGTRLAQARRFGVPSLFANLTGVLSTDKDSEEKIIAHISMIKQGNTDKLIRARALAEAVYKMSFFDIELVINAGIPESQIQKVLRLVVDVYYSQYSPFFDSPITLRDYPDLGFIGLYLRETLTGMSYNRLSNISLHPSNAAAKYPAFLVRLCNAMLKLDKEIGPGRPGSANQSVSAKDRMAKREQEQINAWNEGRFDDWAAVRKDWPPQAQNLHFGAIEISKEDMNDEIRESLTDRAKGFNRLMRIMHGVSVRPLNLPTTRCQLPQTMLDDLALWNVEIPEVYSRAVESSVPTNGDAAKSPRSWIEHPTGGSSHKNKSDEVPQDGGNGPEAELPDGELLADSLSRVSLQNE